MANKNNVPASKRVLAILLMVLLAYLYYRFNGQPASLSLKKINQKDIQIIKLYYNNKAETIRDEKTVKNIIDMYNNAKGVRVFKDKIDPPVTLYIKTGKEEVFVAGYNKEQVVIQYKNNSANKQYLAKETNLARYLGKL